MKTIPDIVQLAFQKIAEAELLHQHGFYDTAFYIGGYSVELRLKAKVCKTLDIPDFFDETAKGGRRIPSTQRKGSQQDNLYKPFKVHDYEQLVILCGLYSEVRRQLANDANFDSDWSTVTAWSEQCRYEAGRTAQEVADAINAFRTIAQWIQSFL